MCFEDTFVELNIPGRARVLPNCHVVATPVCTSQSSQNVLRMFIYGMSQQLVSYVGCCDFKPQHHNQLSNHANSYRMVDSIVEKGKTSFERAHFVVLQRSHCILCLGTFWEDRQCGENFMHSLANVGVQGREYIGYEALSVGKPFNDLHIHTCEQQERLCEKWQRISTGHITSV